MRIALFGGTFNPVHVGHLLIAEAARRDHQLDKVIFVPAGKPPHKKAPRTSSRDRVAMLRLAVRDFPAFAVSDWEISQKRVVYTYETLAHFHAKSPRDKLFFLVGSDSMKNLRGWRNPKLLRRLARFISYDRIPPFASHLIRQRVRQGKTIQYLVGDPIGDYIQSHRLYRRPE